MKDIKRIANFYVNYGPNFSGSKIEANNAKYVNYRNLGGKLPLESFKNILEHNVGSWQFIMIINILLEGNIKIGEMTINDINAIAKVWIKWRGRPKISEVMKEAARLQGKEKLGSPTSNLIKRIEALEEENARLKEKGFYSHTDNLVREKEEKI